jgi:hypothetical protein
VASIDGVLAQSQRLRASNGSVGHCCSDSRPCGLEEVGPVMPPLVIDLAAAPFLGLSGRTRSPWTAVPGMVVVACSSARVSRPVE